MDTSSTASRKSTAPRVEISNIQGWRAEFRLWWAMTKHVDIVFDKSPASLQHLNLPNATPGSISMCRGCCQILSTRTCSGQTTETASGCTFHRERPDVPIAVRSVILSTRLREMLKPSMIVERYYLQVAPSSPSSSGSGAAAGAEEDQAGDEDAVQTNLMNVGWVKRIRLGNRETRRSRKVYVHDPDGGCLHSKNPDVIVQGLGPKHMYFKRCDGLFVNALGDKLTLTEAPTAETVPAREEEDEDEEEDKGKEKAFSFICQTEQPQQQDDDITPTLEGRENDDEDDEDNEGYDDNEFTQKPDPWANVIIDPVVNTESEPAPATHDDDDDNDNDSNEKNDSPSPSSATPTAAAADAVAASSSSSVAATAAAAPCPPPRTSSCRRRNDHNNDDQHHHNNHTTTAAAPTPTPAPTHPRSPSPGPAPPPPSFSRRSQPQPQPQPQPPTQAQQLPTNLDVPESKLAELAWRQRNPAIARAEDHEDAIEREERQRRRRAQKRRWFLLWLR